MIHPNEVLAQEMSSTPSSDRITSISPSPADTQITATGSAIGGFYEGTYYCPPKALQSFSSTVRQIPTNLTYSFDGGPSFSGPDSTLVHSGEDTVSCPPDWKGLDTYRYSFSFTDSTNIAGLSNGDHTLQVCLGGTVCDSATFSVQHPPTYTTGPITKDCTVTATFSGGGTIDVTSNNSQTGTPVNASWTIAVAPSSGGSTALTGSGTAQTYSSQPVGLYTMASVTPPAGYAFNSIKLVPPANKDGSILALIKNIFAPIALAWNVPNGTAQTLLSGGTDTFNIQLDPIANIGLQTTSGVATSSLSLSAQANTAASGQIQVVNTGTSGSTLTWTAATSDSSWLTAPTSNSSGISTSTPETVTINATGLSAGNYTGHITFTGTSQTSLADNIPSPSGGTATLTVNLVVTSQQCPNGDAYVSGSCVKCSNGGCSGGGGTPVNPVGSLVCNNGATNPPTCTPTPPTPTATLLPASQTINVGQSATLNWSSTNATSCTGSGFTANGTSGSFSTGALNTPGTQNYQVSCSGPGGTSPIVTASVNVISPNATISAVPSRVTGSTTNPGSSTISWSSGNVQSCAVTRNGIAWQSGLNSSGVVDNNITSQTVYTITCQTGGSPVTNSTTVNITPAFQEF